MNIYIQFWKVNTNSVCTCYYTSAFLATTYTDILKAFKSALPIIDLKGIFQILMDGPNVNHKDYWILRDLIFNIREGPDDPTVMNIGTAMACVLCIVHLKIEKG